MDYIIKTKVEKMGDLISDFSCELEKYLNDMLNEVSKCNEALIKLGESWELKSYDNFKEIVVQSLDEIKKRISEGTKVKESLDEDAEIFRIAEKLFEDSSK